MRLLRLSSFFLLVLIVTGCCSVVAKSGDAKILRCPQLIHTPGTKMFRMVLPSVSLAQAGSQVLQVRGLPANLKGLFIYSLSMDVPPEEAYPYKDRPWNDAKISVAFRRLDGTDAFEDSFILGTSAHGFSQAHDGYEVGWNLGVGLEKSPLSDESFDIVVKVEQPSRRTTDKIAITAFAVYRQKP